MLVDASKDPVSEVVSNAISLWKFELFAPSVTKYGDSAALFAGMRNRTAPWVEGHPPVKSFFGDDLEHSVVLGVEPLRTADYRCF